jgi:uncharacterized small protein (DUF1192 family)
MTCQQRNDAFMDEIRKMDARIAGLEEDRDRAKADRDRAKADRDRANKRIAVLDMKVASLEADRDRKNALRRLRQFFQDNSAGRGRLPDGAERRFYDRFNRVVNEGHFHAAHGLSHEEFAGTVEACRAVFTDLPILTGAEIEAMWAAFNGAGRQ